MLAEFLDSLLALKRPETVDLGDKTYATHSLMIPPAEPTASPLAFSTLSSLVEYLRSSLCAVDARPEMPYALHVQSESKVAMVGALEGRSRHREILAISTAEAGPFKGGSWYSLEELRIALLVGFEPTDALTELVSTASKVTDIREDGDDGISQHIVQRLSVANKGTAQTTSKPIELAPWRTFREVAQPPSPFFLRLRGNAETGIQGGLFAGDGDSWKLEARERIAQKLEALLRERSIVNIPVFR